jgi:N-acetylneuraminic acid mutarotase
MEASKVWESVVTVSEAFSPRTGHTAIADDNLIYVFGGTDGVSRNNDIWAFDPHTSAWRSLPTTGAKPAARSGTQAVIQGSKIYIFGGYTKKDGDFFNDVHSFDTTTSTWTELVPTTQENIPLARTDHSLTLYGNSLYVFGGYDGSHRFNDLRQFSLSSNTWRNLASDTSPESCFGHTAVECKDKMIVFGGWNGHDTLNEVWSFSFLTNRWSRVITTGFIPPRYRHSAILVGNSMFVFGGVNKDQQRFNDVFELNVNLKHWIRVEAEGAVPTARTFHRAVLFEGYMFILGGFDGVRRNDTYKLYLQDLSPEDELESNPLSLFESREQEEDQPYVWRLVRHQGEVYTRRTGHTAEALNGIFYVFGGTDEHNRKNDIHAFTSLNKQWRKLPGLGEVPLARSGAKGSAYQDKLYFFGGYTKKDGTYFNDLVCYDVNSYQWATLNPSGRSPSPRTDHTVVRYEHSLFIFAGYDGRTRYNDLYRADLDSLVWETINPGGAPPLTRFGHTAVVFNHSMYIFGGWDGHETLDDLYQYSFASNIWYELRRVQGSRPSPRYRHSMVAYGKSLFIFGGVDKQQVRYNDLYEFQTDTKEWSVKHASGQMPTSRTFHRALMHGDDMYILGGFDGKRQNDLYVIKLSRTPSEHSSRPSSAFSRSYDIDDDAMDYEALLRQNRILKQQVSELSDRLHKEEERDQCKVTSRQICFEREIDSVLLDCCHRLMCTRCANKTSIVSCT